jgi:hypothetical protein
MLSKGGRSERVDSDADSSAKAFCTCRIRRWALRGSAVPIRGAGGLLCRVRAVDGGVLGGVFAVSLGLLRLAFARGVC